MKIAFSPDCAIGLGGNPVGGCARLLLLSKFSHMKKIIADSLFILHFMVISSSWQYHSFILCPGNLEFTPVSLCVPQRDGWKL